MKARGVTTILAIVLLATATRASSTEEKQKTVSLAQSKTKQGSADGLSGAYSPVSKPKGIGAKIVAKMKRSPSNPDVTCIRAKVAVNIAKDKLEQAKGNLKKAIISNYRIKDARQLVLRCQEIYDKAFQIYKSVQIAKKETNVALKKYETIEKKAKEAERKAIVAEEQVQIAKSIVKKAERFEYKVRKCHRKPRKLTKLEQVLVKKLVHKNKQLSRKKVQIVRVLKRLTTLVKRLKGHRKKRILRKVTRLNKILKRIEKKQHSLTRAVRIIEKPDHFKRPKRKLITEEVTIVKKIKTKKEKVVKKIQKLTKTIKYLTKQLPKLPDEKKVLVEERVKVMKKIIKRLERKVRLFKITIKSIENVKIKGKRTKVSKKNKKLIRRYKKKTKKLKTRRLILTKKIKKLKKVLKRLPKVAQTRIMKRIAYLQTIKKKTTRRIKKYKKQVHLLKSNKKKLVKRTITRFERSVIKRIRRVIIKKVKKINVVKREIKSLNRLSKEDPESKPDNNIKIKEYHRIITKTRQSILHLKHSIRKIQFQVEYSLKPRPKKPKFRKVSHVEKLMLHVLTKKVDKYVRKVRRTTNKVNRLTTELKKAPPKQKKILPARIAKLKKIMKRYHSKYVSTRKLIHRIAPQNKVRSERPPKRKIKHYLHNIFRCQMVPAPPQLRGPYHTKHEWQIGMKSLFLEIQREKKALGEVQHNVASLEKLIQYHQSMIVKLQKDLRE